MYKDISKTKSVIKRGAIFNVDLGETGIGSEQKGYRPALIIQNNVGNRHSTTVVVAVITTKDKHKIPTHVDADLYRPSTIMCEQLITIDKARLSTFIGVLNEDKMNEVDKALAISLGLDINYK